MGSLSIWHWLVVGVIVLLLRRREASDWVFVALLGGTLAFVATFAVISVACDYRYLYFTDLAAMTGLIYAAVDPVFFGRRSRLSPTRSAGGEVR